MHFCHLVVILLDVARVPSIMENNQTDNHVTTLNRRMLLGRITGALIVLGALVTGILVILAVATDQMSRKGAR